MTIHDDLLIEFKVKANINLESKDVWQSRDLSLDYLPGKKFYVLLEGDDDASVYGEARRVGASEEFTKHAAALALYSNKAYERITGSLFLKINTPKVPTDFFDDREKAIAWLKIKQKSIR
jgi:hypothetical protein